MEITLQLFKVHPKVTVSDYIVPLKYPEWNQELLIKGFKRDYSERNRLTFYPYWDVNEELRKVVPKSVVEHMHHKPLVVHYHRERPTKMFVPIHIDGKDSIPQDDYNAAIQLPIIGCDHKCLTNFWYAPDGFEYEELTHARIYKSGFLENAVEYCMTDQPLLFNTKQLHSTANYNKWERERCIISWRFKPYITWNDAKDMLSEFLQPFPHMTDLAQLD